MKDYINYDEEVDFSDEESGDTDCENVEEEMYTVKNTKRVKKFNLSDFDAKVARTIVEIHRKARGNDGFSRWVDKNLQHLSTLHRLSNLDCSPVDFYTYIYENSSRT